MSIVGKVVDDGEAAGQRRADDRVDRGVAEVAAQVHGERAAGVDTRFQVEVDAVVAPRPEVDHHREVVLERRGGGEVHPVMRAAQVHHDRVDAGGGDDGAAVPVPDAGGDVAAAVVAELYD